MQKKINNENIFFIIIFILLIGIFSYFIYNYVLSINNITNNTSNSNKTSYNNYADKNHKENNKNSENIKNNDNINNNNNNNTLDENIKNDDLSNINIQKSNENDFSNTLSTFSTSIYDKDKNRIENINLAISKLNGKIIKKDEEFSFNNTIGKMDEQNGFKKALGFDSKGKKIQIFGGGICQISSTLYNAALICNLKITERHPHSKRVYYVPKNKDATILYGKLDLKFINNTDSDIKIEATTDNVTVKITLLSNKK